MAEIDREYPGELEDDLLNDPSYREVCDAQRDAWMEAIDADPAAWFTPVLHLRGKVAA